MTPGWLEHRPGPSWEGKAARVAALIVLALSVPALVGSWIWLFPDRPPTPMLVLSISGYDAPAPPNAFAEEDATRFESAFASYKNIRLTRDKSPQTSGELLDAIEDYLRRVRPGGPDKQVVLIYLSVHGIVNDQGEPCLYLPMDKPLDSADWLPVSKLLDVLEQRPDSNQYTTVLLLDAHRIKDPWRMGVVVNSFPHALESLAASSRYRNCTILTSASAWQSADAAPEISATTFGYYTARGLRGDADRQGNDDKVVTLDELADYLGQQVNAWSTLHRGAAQQPRVLGQEQEMLRLVDVAGSAEIQTVAWKPPIDREEFRKIFDRVGTLERSRAYARYPHHWAKVQFLLECLDAEALAGAAYATTARNDTLSKLNATLSELEAQKSPPPILKPLTLAVRSRLSQAVPEDLSAVWAAWQKDPAAKVPAGYDEAATFTWNGLTQDGGPLTHDDLAKRLEFCRLAGAPNGPDYAELAMVRMLEQYVDWPSQALEKNVTPRRLLAARRESESLAATEDPRVHYVLAGSMQKADHKLAAALDQTLVGDDDALYRAEQGLTELLGADRNSYKAIDELADLMLAALHARDQAFSTLLHLNQLLIRRARWDADLRGRSDIRRLAGDSITLARHLDEVIGQFPEALSPADVTRLRDLTTKVDAGKYRLLTEYATRVVDVAIEEGGSRDQTARETPHLLACPVDFDEGRQRLHEQWIERVTSLQATNTQNALPSKDADVEHDLDYLRWLAADGVAPLQAFIADGDDSLPASQARERSETGPIDAQSSEDAIAAKLAELGGHIRRTLRSAPAVYEQLRDQSTDAIANQPASKARAGLSRADALSRRIAPLVGNAVRFGSDEDPAVMLHKLDERGWILWHGHRVLDDCWGSVAGSNDGPPYFAVASAQAANDAEGLYLEATYGVKELRKRILETQRIVNDWTPLITKDLFVAEEGHDFLTHQVEFRGDSKMPSGVAAVYLTDEKERAFRTYSQTGMEIRRAARDIQKGGTLNHQLQAGAVSNVPVLYANALFRGHTRNQIFSIGRGVFVEWERPEPKEASIVVSGESKQISQIYFIVDCSATMEDGDKMNQGRVVLQGILEELAKRQEQFHVGLIFYGRRAGWQKVKDERGRDSWDAKWLNKAEYSGPPGEDVEIASSIKRLQREHLAELKSLLTKAKPFGETPLYLAMVVALQRFEFDIAGPRRLIVITDGVNHVEEDSSYPAVRKSPQDVVDALAKHPTKIDVIEFGGKTVFQRDWEREEWEPGRAQLRRIVQSKDSMGMFRQAKDAHALKDELQNSLRLDRYQLTFISGSPNEAAVREWTELGERKELPAPTAKTNYRVSLQTHNPTPAEVEVSGGEALQLTYQRPPANRLVFPAYKPDDRRLWHTVNGTTVTSYVPTFELQDPVFRISLERISLESEDERLFSHRPDIIWAKAESIEQGDRRSHYFFDPIFESGLPVPMLNLRARNWTGSDFARLELSFVVDDAVLQQPWSAIPKVGSATIESHDAVLQVKSEIDGGRCRVVVDEKHSGAQDFPLHIQLDPPPDRIRRTLFESDRSARHVFDYDVQPANPKLRVLSQREIETAGARVVFERIELGD